MKTDGWRVRGCRLVYLSVLLVGWGGATALAAPTFISTDPRLPNPERPYAMEGIAEFGAYSLSGLQIWATDADQLDTPMTNMDGDWEFDSTFDVGFSAYLGFGLAPAVPISGTGMARAVGLAPGDGPALSPLVYDTEMLSLSLQGVSPVHGAFMFRESPTQESNGVTTTEDLCPVCAGPFFGSRISSFFDVFTELSVDGGANWTPATGSFRILQTPEPGTAGLGLICGGVLAARRRRSRR